MKLRDLTHGFEGFSHHVRAWPPIWVPVIIRRSEERLSLRMRYEGQEHTAGLSWDPPPSLTDVEQLLRAHLGRTIKDIGELDVR